MLNLNQYDFVLPPELIALKPTEPRENSILMIVRKSEIVKDKFLALKGYLPKDALLVFNHSRVIPARLLCRKESGGSQELLFLREIAINRFTALARGIKKLKVNQLINCAGVELKIINIDKEKSEVLLECSIPLAQLLAEQGKAPLPPYILKLRAASMDADDILDYQTVYQAAGSSIAAPTAGLHFSTAQLDEIKANFGTTFINLNIGQGTFSPLTNENILQNKLHKESYAISLEAARLINIHLQERKPVVAVGTTALRALESAFVDGKVQSGEYETEIFITPGYKFNVVSHLITNFHLPKSSLYLLVNAFAGKKVKEAYQMAITEKLRFYSFGDSMLLERA